jgi:lipoate-protein ligase A
MIPRIPMTRTGFLLVAEDFDGPMNMALDEVLWQYAALGVPYLRLYGWADRPSISLGYFQSAEEVLRGPEWRGVPFVRRLTGGGAIVHDHDLTYSLALPARLAPGTNDFYDRVHRAITAAFVELGIPAQLGGGDSPPGDPNGLCFLRGDRFAVTLHGFKILGSAQRRGPESVLMHGSVLLARSEIADGVLGLREILGHEGDRGHIRQAIVRATQGAIGQEFRPIELPTELRQQAAQLAEEKYRTEIWNYRLRIPGSGIQPGTASLT